MSNSSDLWSSDVEDILKAIQSNSVILSNEHKKRFLQLQKYLRFFKLPCILLSSVNAVFSVSLSNFIDQSHTSMICSLISLITTVITSTEMFLNIEKGMIRELEVSREYYLLSVDISKTLRLDRTNRTIEAGPFLDSCISIYKNLFESSALIERKIKDSLVAIDPADMPFFVKPSSDDLDVEKSGKL